MLAILSLAMWLSISGVLATPPVCTWSAPTANAFSACGVNDKFVISLASTVGKTGSPYAKATIAGSVGGAACSAHDANTAAGRASCAADTKHQCFIDTLDGLSLLCSSNAFTKAFVSVVCPNTAYHDVNYCASLTKSECLASSACGFTLLQRFGPSPALVQVVESWYKNYTGSDNTFLGQYTTCYSNAELDAAIKTGVWDGVADELFYNAAIDSSDATQYFSSKGRGDCPYGKNAFSRSKGQGICATFNTLNIESAGQVAILSSNHVANIKATVMAIAAGCVFYTTGKTPFNKAFNNISAEWVTAIYDPVLAAETRFNAATDGKLYKAATLCPRQDHQYNQVACKEARV